jgi:hypothetical protein
MVVVVLVLVGVSCIMSIDSIRAVGETRRCGFSIRSILGFYVLESVLCVACCSTY